MTQTSNPNPNRTNSTKPIKFLYSYNGQILPRRSDGMLRYIGGYTRVLSVDRSITFAELMVKFGELCGASMKLKCKLPSEDLDVLISIKSDEELENLIKEYDRVSELTEQEMKIRAVLFPVHSLKKISPPSSPIFYNDSLAPPAKCLSARTTPRNFQQFPALSCESPPARVVYTAGVRNEAGRGRCCPRGSPRRQYLVPYSNYCR